jgi:hypothetical protein
MFFVYYNGESENYREEMRWCRCYEGQRVRMSRSLTHWVDHHTYFLYANSSEEVLISLYVIFSRMKKGQDQGKENVTLKL